MKEINTAIEEIKGSPPNLGLPNVGKQPDVVHEPAGKRKRGRPPVVDDIRFIELWNHGTQNGTSLQDVAKELGIAPASASVRASLLRKRGKALFQFRRGRPKKI